VTFKQLRKRNKRNNKLKLSKMRLLWWRRNKPNRQWIKRSHAQFSWVTRKADERLDVDCEKS